MKRVFVALFLLSLIFSCTNKLDKEQYEKFTKAGEEISVLAQGTLLKNVGAAMAKGGPEYAVEFCNLKASSIIDSLNAQYNCTINRVSDKNRNPEARLNKLEQKLWEQFESGKMGNTLVPKDGTVVYYKPIKIAMPACLKCHGTPGTDINEATAEKLLNLYPEDLATGYALNDFRGLWKIEFKRQ